MVADCGDDGACRSLSTAWRAVTCPACRDAGLRDARTRATLDGDARLLSAARSLSAGLPEE